MSRKEQAAASRASLVEAGRKCFADVGYEATTVSTILELAGMARGALYHYFPGGKRELFEAVFVAMNQEFHKKRDSLAVLESPLDRVREGVRLFLDLCTERDFAQIMLVDAPAVIPGQQGRGSTFELLRVQLEEAMGGAGIRAYDPDLMAVALYGAVRSVGEVVASSPTKADVARAVGSIDALLDGLERS